MGTILPRACPALESSSHLDIFPSLVLRHFGAAHRNSARILKTKTWSGGRSTSRNASGYDRAMDAKRIKAAWRAVIAGSRGRRLFPLLLAGTVGACSSPLSPEEAGYDFTLPLESPVVYRWPTGAAVRVHAAPTGDPQRDRLLADAVHDAVADWQAVLGEGQVRLMVTGGVSEADVVVQWSDGEPPVSTAGCEPVLSGSATTTFCRAADGRGLEPFPLPGESGGGTVRMLVTVRASEATGPVRVRQLVAHELGHVLGIGRHSPDPDDLMWDGPLTRHTPSPTDAATVRRLYETAPDLLP